MPDPASWILRNATTRPVELHRPEGVVVLPPRGTISVSAADPVLDALERRGVLTRHAPAEPPEPTADAGGDAAPEPAADTPAGAPSPGAESAAGDAGDARPGAHSSRRTRKSSRYPHGESA